MTRIVDFQVRVLRNGGRLTSLKPIGAPQIRMDDSGGIPTSFSGEFYENPLVDWLTDELQPVMEINGEETELGVFRPATVTLSIDKSTRSLRVEAYDRCWTVRDHKTETMIFFAAGDNYVDTISGLLIDCGISLILATPSSETFLTDRQDWPIGTSYLDIVNELLREINYKPLYFSGQGMAMIEPMVTPNASNIQHTLDSDDIQSMLLPNLTKESDIYSAPNVFVCVCSSVDRGSPLSVTVENTNPESPLSIMRRGRRIVQLVNVDNIASISALEAYANRILFESMSTGETIAVSTAIKPGFGVDDIVALHYGDTIAICVERGWTIELATGGTMTHRLERMVLNLGI